MTPPASSRNADGGIFASAARYYQKSYFADYIGFAALLTGYLCLVLLVHPFHRLFYVNDIHIAYPHAEIERVPVWLNFVYALFVPLSVILLALFAGQSPKHKYHVTILGFAITLILSSFITDLVKNAVGRPRPDLISRCKPPPDTPTNVLLSYEICTETRQHTLHDGWRSFPSGHSSFSFAGLGFLSLFLAGQLQLFVTPHHWRVVGESEMNQAAHVRGDLGKALLCLAPLLGAAMIGISRCQDYRHDVYDVSVGALLGYVVAHWSYRRYYPSLSSPRCYEPYSAPGEKDTGRPSYGRLRDEEDSGAGRNVGYEMEDLT